MEGVVSLRKKMKVELTANSTVGIVMIKTEPFSINIKYLGFPI